MSGPSFRTARPILGRVKANDFVEAGPHDFRLGAEAAGPARWWSPYSIDDQLKTVWWVGTGKALHSYPEPFYYLAQYRHATHLARCRVDDLPPTRRRAATLVMSVGRCGSTVLTRMAQAGGLPCLSEPDVLTPLVIDRPAAPHGARIYARAIDAAMRGWDRVGAGERIVVKLRAQHSNPHHVALAARALDVPRFVFVFREPQAWARSMVGHFGLPAERLVALYEAPSAARAVAIRLGAEVRTLRFEDIPADPGAVREALGIERDVDPPRESSQAGTRLAQRPSLDRRGEEAVAGFMARWPSIKARHGLDLYD